MKKNPLEKAISIVGSQLELARRCGVQQQHIYNWLKRQKRVPANRVIDVERATNGLVKRYELRPDIYPPEDYKE